MVDSKFNIESVNASDTLESIVVEEAVLAVRMRVHMLIDDRS
jgi:hypothetical protein